MGNGTGHNSIAATPLKRVLQCALFGAAAVLIPLVCLKIYLNTPLAAAHISRLLSDYLHQPVRVAAMDVSGSSLSFRGVALASPPGFPAGDLVALDTLTIAPDWWDLIRGKRSLRLVELERVRIGLWQNSSGVWNFAGLQRLLTGGKPAAGELFIQRLRVREGSLNINGEQVQGISLAIANLATRGSAGSAIELAFEDEGRNRYVITGRGRLGGNPELDLSLSAPSISLGPLAKRLKGRTAFLPREGTARILMSATMRARVLTARGQLDFSRMAIAGIGAPLDGSLAFALEYDLRADRLRLESMELAVADVVRGRARGTVEDLRQKRRFALEGTVESAEVSALAAFLPELKRRGIAVGGRLASLHLKLVGTATAGITAATGSMALRNGRISRDGLLLVSGLDTAATLSSVTGGLGIEGRLRVVNPSEKAVLEELDAPFRLSLGKRMQPARGELPSLSARVMGVPVTASFGFSPGAAVPLSARLRIPSTAVATLNPLLKRMDLSLAAGRASLSLDLAGQGADNFSGAVRTELAGVRGERGSTPFALKKGDLASRLVRDKGRLSLSGTSRLEGLGLNRMTADAQFDYRATDGLVTLQNARLRLDDTSLAIAGLTARIPARTTVSGLVRYPLSVEVAGANVSRGEARVEGLSGLLKADYVSGQGDRWLEGQGELRSGPVSWQLKPVGSCLARVSLSRAGARVDLSGAVAGGTLEGSASVNPFALKEGGRFRVGTHGARLAALNDLAGTKGAVAVSNGLLDLAVSGAYSAPKGMDCRFEATGRDIALKGGGNKTMVSGAGIRLNGTLSGQRLSVKEAVVTVGQGVALKGQGTIENVLSPRREGRVAFSLARTPVAAIVDPLVNMLPRLIQEATVGGALAAEGVVELHGGRQLLEGAITLEHLRLDAPSQKFSVTDVSGRLPFSLGLSAAGAPEDHVTTGFTRANYPRILERFRTAAGGQPSLRVARAVFGPLELGPLAVQVRAGGGVTEITALGMSLYEGELLGNGVVTVKDGLWYRADLLLNALSLKRLCSAFPRIEGYISGRVDGLVSIRGAGHQLTKISGFADLWAKEASREKMLVSKEFLQRLSGKKLSGFFFSADRPYDRAEITVSMEKGYLTFETLDILHTNLFGVRDLTVAIAPSQNRISLDHLVNSIREAATRGKTATGGEPPAEAEPGAEFKWQE